MLLAHRKQKARFKQSKNCRTMTRKVWPKQRWTRKKSQTPAQNSWEETIRRNLLQRFSQKENRNTRETKWKLFHWATNLTTVTHKSSLSSQLKSTKPCWQTRSRTWSTQIISKKSKQKSKIPRGPFWLNGSLMFIENSDWLQSAYTSPSTSSINLWARRRSRKTNFIYSVSPPCSWLLSMKKSIHQSSEIFLRWAKTNSQNKPFCKWRRTFFMLLISNWRAHLLTDSYKGSEEWVWPSMMMKFSSMLNICKKSNF